MIPRRWWPPIAWASLLLLATSFPNPGVSGFSGADKLVHGAFYGILAALVVRAMLRIGGWKRLATTAIALSAFGAVDEWHQGFIPGRSPSIADWGADSIGALVGLLTATAARQRREIST